MDAATTQDVVSVIESALNRREYPRNVAKLLRDMEEAEINAKHAAESAPSEHERKLLEGVWRRLVDMRTVVTLETKR